MNTATQETELAAARVAYIDRARGAMQGLLPGLEGLHVRGFTLAVCMVPVDGAGPIIPLWDMVGAQEEEPEPEATEEEPEPVNRVADFARPNGVTRGDT